MSESDQFARARMIIARIVSEKIPQAKRWSVPKEFKSWIDTLSNTEFKAYLDRLSGLTRNLSDEEYPQQTGVFISGKSYPVEKMETKRRLDLIGGEANCLLRVSTVASSRSRKARPSVEWIFQRRDVSASSL